MNKNEKGFSLIVVVIFMSVAALFVGYLMGSWLISFLVEDDAEIAEGERNSSEISQQNISENRDQPQKIDNQENNLPAPTPEERNIASQPADTENSAAEDNTDQNSDSDGTQTAQSGSEAVQNSEVNNIEGDFAVQIGAFSNYNNALSVKSKVEELGYQILITDTSPHQVQVVGYSSRNAAESILEELKSEGYNGFIVVRE